MNWDALGAIAELVGAIGVIATLAFLAYQLRQNSELLKHTGHQLEQGHRVAIAQALSEANSQSDPLLVVAQNEGLSQLLFKGLRDFRGLSSEDRFRFSMAMGPIVAAVGAQLDQQRALGLGDEMVAPYQDFLMRFVDLPGGREWWAVSSEMYQKQLVDLIDAALERRAAARQT